MDMDGMTILKVESNLIGYMKNLKLKGTKKKKNPIYWGQKYNLVLKKKRKKCYIIRRCLILGSCQGKHSLALGTSELLQIPVFIIL